MVGSFCKIHEQLGQLFDIVEQLSSTALERQTTFGLAKKRSNAINRPKLLAILTLA
jgi:hypothetical protein